MRPRGVRTGREKGEDAVLAQLESLALQYGYRLKDLLADSKRLRKQLNLEENLILLIVRGIKAFGSQKQWNVWLRSPCGALQGKTPLEILIAEEGLRKLHMLLDRTGRGSARE